MEGGMRDRRWEGGWRGRPGLEEEKEHGGWERRKGQQSASRFGPPFFHPGVRRFQFGLMLPRSGILHTAG